MFCRNCGSELKEDSLCRNCGFDGNDGNSHCPHCGKEVQPGQKLCIKCGFMISEPVKNEVDPEKKKEEKPKNEYKKYEETVKKLHILNLIKQALVVLVVVTIIFCPFFKHKVYLSDVDYGDIKDLEDLGEAMQKGYVEKSFSIYDDIRLKIKNLTNDDMNPETHSVSEMFSLFLIMDAFALALVVVTVTKKTYGSISAINDIDSSTMLEYNEMKKSGKKSKNMFSDEGRDVFLFLFCFGLDIMYACFLGTLSEEAARDGIDLISVSHFTTLSGVSNFALSLVALSLILYVFARLKHSKAKKEMLISVTKEDY